MSEYYERAKVLFGSFSFRREYFLNSMDPKDAEREAFIRTVRSAVSQLDAAERELETLRRRYRWLERARTCVLSRWPRRCGDCYGWKFRDKCTHCGGR